MAEQIVKAVKCTVPKEEVMRIKGLGFLRDKRSEDKFNGRVITRNGMITSEECEIIAKAAKKFGSGKVAFTSRMTVEVQGIPYANIDAFCAFLNENSLETGGTGAKVRPVVSCKGTTCQFGLIDTYALSLDIHNRFYKGYHDVTLPHKFKIAVGGCPNNCVKPELNDIGIIGQRVPEFDADKCKACKKCAVQDACPIKVARLEDGKIKRDESECNNCGRCIEKCPFAVTGRFTNGYKVYIGGRWGKKTAVAQPLPKIFTSREEVLDVIEKAICFFKEKGIQGERFADTIARIGFDETVKEILG